MFFLLYFVSLAAVTTLCIKLHNNSHDDFIHLMKRTNRIEKDHYEEISKIKKEILDKFKELDFKIDILRQTVMEKPGADYVKLIDTKVNEALKKLENLC